VDELIWNKFAIQCAILVSDSSQFSHKAHVYGIIHYLALIQRSQELLFPIIQNHGGQILKAEADNILAIFPLLKPAIESGIGMHRALAACNASIPPDEECTICIGIGWGKVLHFMSEVFGDEANAAYKLGEDVAGENEILLTSACHEELKKSDAYIIQFHRRLNLSEFCFDSYKLVFDFD